MTVTTTEPAIDDFAEDLYDRLRDKLGVGGTMSYLARNWLSDFLRPLGYERTDQDAVCRALEALKQAGLAERCAPAHRAGEYNREKRPHRNVDRTVTITVLR